MRTRTTLGSIFGRRDIEEALMSKKKTRKHRILGTIKAEHVPILAEHPHLEPLPTPEVAPPPIEETKEDHVVVAIPETLWQRVQHWFD
jgi:hypothetical protein